MRTFTGPCATTSIREVDTGCELQAFGWTVVTAGSALFVVQSVRSGDVLGVLASVGFLAGCVVFLAPYVVHWLRE